MQIKIRAWDKDSETMIYGVGITPESDGGIPYQIPVNAHDFDQLDYYPNSIIMLYTGLKDKNGTEIYEGDIVIAWSAGVKAICEVKWGRGRAGFFLYRKPNIAWNLSGGGKDYNEENVEVIGNRYTHPHLLGGEEE